MMAEKVGRNLSLTALIVLLVLLPFENKLEAVYQGAEVAVLLGFLVRLYRQTHWRYWAVAVGAYLVSLGLFAGIAWLHVHSAQSEFPVAEIFRTLLVQVGILYFCMILVFLTQFVFRPEGWKPCDRWMKTTLALAWGFGVVVLISALCSLHPFESLAYCRKYVAPYLLIYMITVETLHSWRHYRFIIGAIYLVGIIATSVAVTARYVYDNGGYDLKSKFERSEIVRREVRADKQEETRIQWPFRHHNRLCSYALIVTLFVWLQFFATRNWELKTLVAISAVIPVWCILLTLTRGGYIALAAAALALVLMIHWRSVWILLALAVVAWFVSPSLIRERLKSLVHLKTYIEAKGTFGLRRQLWIWSLGIIREHPMLGLGAGWEVFEDYIKTNHPEKDPEMETPHAHNNFLEIAAESGLGAMALFLAFTAGLVVQIGRAWRHTARQTKRRFVVAGFFALLIAITVFGLGSYSLRYTVGMLVWVCFALMTLLPLVARAIPEETR